MKLEDELKMQQFTDNFQKAYLNILFTGNWLEARMQKSLKVFNITTSQYNVLRILRGQKGQPMSAFAIQERMLHRTSNVTRILEKLVEKGLVTRESKSSNRRMIDVMLTAKGAELLKASDEMANESHLQFARTISEAEALQMSDWLDTIRNEHL
ncbi:MarR family winged helix-turn-helix transcriptional regulator [Taibaiella chishuiensis]|uniref:DNA-binding MarR family transcriptional regulator n=1 Tax=Taibaiella chishuiensis TaxID=1434707 RepID=A0A2P8CY77_9BACT|nr:MarR family transcriptional regulator [Taibaiella chishuiensis]PSK89866.1 DNA-binding MarR family transcriptional regulator [Taibaiella chishuiensis]